MNQEKEGIWIRAIYYCIYMYDFAPLLMRTCYFLLSKWLHFIDAGKRGLYLLFSDYEIYQLPQEFWMQR